MDAPTERSLEMVWPRVSERVLATLGRRGIDPATAEDAVQEAVARALERNVSYADADDLARWIHVVAWHVAVDELRRRARSTGPIRDRAGGVDVARLVETRSAVDVFFTLWRDLPPRERAALAFVKRPLNRSEAIATAVRRHRLRARLMAMMEGVLGSA